MVAEMRPGTANSPQGHELSRHTQVGVPNSATDVATAIDDAEERIRAAVPIARVIYLEPDIDRGLTVQ